MKLRQRFSASDGDGQSYELIFGRAELKGDRATGAIHPQVDEARADAGCKFSVFPRIVEMRYGGRIVHSDRKHVGVDHPGADRGRRVRYKENVPGVAFRASGELPCDDVAPARAAQGVDSAPAARRFQRRRREKQIVLKGAGPRLIHFPGNHFVVSGRDAMQNKTDKLAAIAIVDSEIYFDMFGIGVMSLLEMIDDKLGPRGYLLGKQRLRAGHHRAESNADSWKSQDSAERRLFTQTDFHPRWGRRWSERGPLAIAGTPIIGRGDDTNGSA
jgi:hypothetical protein